MQRLSFILCSVRSNLTVQLCVVLEAERAAFLLRQAVDFMAYLLLCAWMTQVVRVCSAVSSTVSALCPCTASSEYCSTVLLVGSVRTPNDAASGDLSCVFRTVCRIMLTKVRVFVPCLHRTTVFSRHDTTLTLAIRDAVPSQHSQIQQQQLYNLSTSTR